MGCDYYVTKYLKINFENTLLTLSIELQRNNHYYNFDLDEDHPKYNEKYKEVWGLMLKPNLEELIANLESEQPFRSLPSRLATTLRNSHQLTQLDGDTLTDLNDMETRLQKENIKTYYIKRTSKPNGFIHSGSSNTQ